MNIQDLTKYDVQNINVSKIINTLSKRKDVFINIVVVILSVFLMSQIFIMRKNKVDAFTTETQALEGKVAAVSDYEKANKNFLEFVKTLPQGPKDVNGVINKLNEFATKNSISISSFSPSGQTNNEFFEMVRVKINIAADNYENIGLFIYDIENSGNNLRVENWTTGGSSQTQTRRWAKSTPSNEMKNSSFTADVEIASINFKR